MKRLLILVSVFLLSSTFSMAQLEVEEAIFYPHSISVIEKGMVILKEGKNFLGFLPQDVNKSSVSVALNCEKASVYSIDLGSSEKTKIYIELNKELENLEDKIEKISQKEKFYHKLIEAVVKRAESPRVSIEKATKLYSYIETQLTELKNRKRELSKRKEAIEKRVHKLKRLKALYAWIEGGGECEIAVNYTTYSGWWHPEYTIRYNEGKITLEMKALLYQNTGKDWNNVKTSFSTSAPVGFLNIPEAKPFFLRRIRKTPILPKMALYKGVKTKRVNITKTEISAFYTAANLINIADGEEKNLTLKIWSWNKPMLERITVPAVREAVYLKAQIKKPDEPLVPGKATIIVENLVSGSSNIESMERFNYLVIPLGIDEDVEVKRRIVDKRIEDKWGGKIEFYIKYAISLYNNKDRVITVKVLEALPVSKDEKIEVEILKDEMKPQPAKINPDGIATWIIKLKPKEKRKIVYAFKVKYPKDLLINAHF